VLPDHAGLMGAVHTLHPACNLLCVAFEVSLHTVQLIECRGRHQKQVHHT
jgi:hypothetical protein